MRVLVIGKGGQVATEVLRADLPDIELVALGRPEIDLTDPAGCAQAIRDAHVDAVINAAAYTAVDKAEAEEDIAHVINADAPAAMARAAAERHIPFLHVSSDYVYDGSGEAPWHPDSPTGPLNAYGCTKLAGDLGVLAASPGNIVLRTSWVFSAHGSNFVKTMLRLGREREALTIVADQIGGPTPAAYIADILLSLAAAIHNGEARGGVYHCAGAPDTSWAGFAREIFRQAGIDCAVEDIPTSQYPTPARRPLNSRLDCTRLHREMGIPRHDWRDGLADVLKELGEIA